MLAGFNYVKDYDITGRISPFSISNTTKPRCSNKSRSDSWHGFSHGKVAKRWTAGQKKWGMFFCTDFWEEFGHATDGEMCKETSQGHSQLCLLRHVICRGFYYSFNLFEFNSLDDNLCYLSTSTITISTWIYLESMLHAIESMLSICFLGSAEAMP